MAAVAMAAVDAAAMVAVGDAVVSEVAEAEAEVGAGLEETAMAVVVVGVEGVEDIVVTMTKVHPKQSSRVGVSYTIARGRWCTR